MNTKFSLLKNILLYIICFFTLVLILLPVFRNLESDILYFLSSHFLYYSFFSLTILIPLVLFFLKLIKKSNTLLFILTNIFCIYMFEIYFEIIHLRLNYQKSWLKKAEILAREQNIKFDFRSKIQFLDSLNSINNNTFSNLSVSTFFNNKNYQNGIPTTNGDTILPLGGISNSFTTLDKENGYFPIIYLDDNGFRNDINLNDINNIDFVLIGDSYAESYSVDSRSTIANTFISKGYSTICLAKAGNGPLSELATLIEYGEKYKPKYVIWFYCFNDLTDLKIELNSELLKKYLYKNGFSQSLIKKQEDVDKILKHHNFLEEQKYHKNNLKLYNHKFSLKRVLRLFHIRSHLIITKKTYNEAKLVDNNYDIFELIIKKANHFVNSWNGKLIFVYLPDFNNYGKLWDNFEIKRKNTFLKSVNMDSILVIDANTIFDKHSNPLELFPFEQFLHYSEKGYRFLTLQLINILKDRNIID